MGETVPRKWRHILVFIMGTILSVTFLLYLAELFFPNTQETVLPQNDRLLRLFIRFSDGATGGYPPVCDASTKIITLSLNQSCEMEDIRIAYRGLIGRDQFEIDLWILSFDREQSFRYRFPIDKAEKMFRLTGKKFRLISAKPNLFQCKSLAESNRG